MNEYESYRLTKQKQYQDICFAIIMISIFFYFSNSFRHGFRDDTGSYELAAPK